MQIDLKRTTKTPISTIGEISIDGRFECYSLEDCEREVSNQPVKSWKIQNETAIPKGKYKVIISFSNRFQKDLPLLLDVDGFSGVRIHSGNVADDTEGCILVGVTKSKDFVGNSRTAFTKFFEQVKKAISNNEEVWIEVS